MSRNTDVPLSAVLIMSDGFTVIAGSATGINVWRIVSPVVIVCTV